MPETDLRTSIKEMLVKNLMLQTTADQIGDDLPLFGPGGLGLDSIDALELVVSMEKTFGVGVPNSEVAAKACLRPKTRSTIKLEKDARRPAISVASAVDRVDELTEAAEGAAMRIENQARQIPDLGLVLFLPQHECPARSRRS